MAGTLFVITAPSGAGKSTLIARLVEAVPDLGFSVSWTTRKPRPGERDGIDYHFSSEDEFRSMVSEGGFLEWAEVHGRLYGTARSQTEQALATGHDLILDIDVQGAEQVRASGIAAVTIFILPPTYETLHARLAGRGTEDAETLTRRLANAAGEVRRYGEFDYLIVNDDLERAANELIAIFRAERCRLPHRELTARRIASSFPEP